MPVTSPIYSVPYLIVLSVFIGCAAWGYSKQNNPCAIRFVCLSAFLLFFGLRGLVGWDWSSYYPSYEALEPLWGDPSRNFGSIGDIGFVAYSTLVRSVSADYHFFIFVSVLLDAIVLNWLFKRYSANYAFSFAVFMVVSLGMEIDTLRNMKSLLLFLLAIPYAQERKPWKYFALVLLAATLHISALLYLPLYFVLNRRIPLWVFICLFAVGNVVYLLQLPVLRPLISAAGNLVLGGRMGSMLNMYLDSDIYSAARGINISYLERLGTSVLVMCYYRRLVAIRPSNRLFVNLFVVYIVVALFTSEMSILFDRVGALFVISYWILWPALAECFAIRTNRRIYVAAITLACYLFVTVRSMSVLYQYDNVLTGAKSYNERIVIFEAAGAELLQ